ncbi:hypothetical protein [Methylobacterium sp. Leaf456]|uniref:hypothetical protein n=1 Tax=Methylobacterium sp. Leaf456 TaxID=1736382 RepID=UPI0012E39546|nr:hypothetical protein [Methylobacterium sp. Leaf456]
MRKLFGAALLVLGAGCGGAFAQATAPAEPRAVPEAARPVEAPAAAVRPGETAPARPLNDPNRTGDDKINGLDVPQMKGEPPTPR